jgi:hypothetical protein
LESLDVWDHKVSNWLFILLVWYELFFIDEFKAGHCSHSIGERSNSSTDFEDEKSLRRKCGRVRPQL